MGELLGITTQGVHRIITEYKIPTSKLGARRNVLPSESVRKILKLKNLTIPKRKFGLHIIKGGTGKSTLTNALSTRAASFGLKTLIIDLDQQANLSTSFDIRAEYGKIPNLYDAYSGQIKGRKIGISDAIIKLHPFLDIIPANMGLAVFDNALMLNSENLSSLFEEILKPIDSDYDIIFIDCPPALSKVTSAAHCYCDHILMPINGDFFSYEGLELTIEHLTIMGKKYGANPEVNVVFNKYDGREKLGRQILQRVSENYTNFVCESLISVTKKIQNSIAAKECVWDKKLKNPALMDLHDLTIEILNLKVWKSEWKSNKYASSLPEIKNGGDDYAKIG